MNWIIIIGILLFVFVIELFMFKGFVKFLEDYMDKMHSEESFVVNDQNSCDINHSLETKNSIIITVTINNKDYKLLIDTGATMCSMNSSILEQPEFQQFLDSKKCDITGIEGNYVSRNVYKLTTTIFNKTIIIPFTSYPFNGVLDCDGILGTNLLKHTGYIIDFKNKKLIHDLPSNI